MGGRCFAQRVFQGAAPSFQHSAIGGVRTVCNAQFGIPLEFDWARTKEPVCATLGPRARAELVIAAIHGLQNAGLRRAAIGIEERRGATSLTVDARAFGIVRPAPTGGRAIDEVVARTAGCRAC